MRKRELSDNEWTSIRKLKETNASWSRIERETGVPRRIAKRVYEKWERTQSMPDLKDARKQVAADAFREHIDSILKMAEYLASSLDIPQTPSEHRTTDDFLQDLWQVDILRRVQLDNLKNSEFERKSVILANEILFKALQSHTQQTRIWSIWQQWKDAWNDCVSASNNLKKSVTTVVENNLDQEPGLLDKLKQANRKHHPLDRIPDAIVWTLWKQALDTNQTEAHQVASVTSRNNRYDVVLVNPVFPNKFSNGVICSFKDKSLAEKAAKACNQSYTSFMKGVEEEKIIEPLKSRILQAKGMVDTFAQMTHPLLLKPMILRSTCDLCPA